MLILHLKRFSYVQSNYMYREKIEENVDFPITSLDLNDLVQGPKEPEAAPVYDLYAVSEHSGGLGGGHYTAVARNFSNNKWYQFNDSSVYEVASEQCKTNKAYVLFYKRRTGSLKWAGVCPVSPQEQSETPP